MSDLERFNRRGAQAILDAAGIVDDLQREVLLDKIMSHSWAVRSWQPSKPDAPADPRIAMIERIAGRRVPDIIRASVLADIGEATEKQLSAARIDWVKKNPRNQDAWTWVSWAKHSGKDNRRKPAAPDQQEPAGFQGLKEWAERHATD